MWTDPFDFQRQLAAAGHGQRNPVCFLIILQQDLSHIQYLLELGIFKVIVVANTIIIEITQQETE